MSHKTQFVVKQPIPVCAGAGYVALDVVINGKNETKPRFWAGGSCGNVLTILAYLGWESNPIARLGNDFAGDRILEDMEHWGVKTNYIHKENTISTPIVIERIKTSYSGTPSHKFEWKCPSCGSRLPKYRPILIKSISHLIEEIPTSQVFYFDRISRSILEIATEQRSCGALIVFEPSRIKDTDLFKESINVAHIVKYSYEQLDSSPLGKTNNVPLEIQTLGAEGLRYRFKCSKKGQNKWIKMKAFHVPKLADTAGAGDWSTAGIIHLLGQNSAEGFLKASKNDIEKALIFGQGMAALKCRYEGARGLMYNLSKNEVSSLIYKIINGDNFEESVSMVASEKEKNIFQSICPACSKLEHSR